MVVGVTMQRVTTFLALFVAVLAPFAPLRGEQGEQATGWVCGVVVDESYAQVAEAELKLYLDAVEDVFGADIDYAQLVKLYGASGENETRYSPAKCIGCISKEITGQPDPKHISTSYVERQNLTMRMHMRRFTRLTNGFSKKIEMHAHNVALHFMYYNFCKIHQTLRVTPAMEAGLSDYVWGLEEIIGLLSSQQTASALTA